MLERDKIGGMETVQLSVADAVKCIDEVRAGEAQRQAHGQAASEECALTEAMSRVLAGHIVAEREAPPFDRSTRDGFAVRAADVCNAGVVLPIAGLTRAGESEALLPDRSAWQVMTGAPVPRGADAVVMQEFVTVSGTEAQFDLVPLRGQNIVVRGAEARTGEILLNPGVRLGAAEIGLAASCGYTQLKVHARPRVMILTTGDELVESDATPRLEQIRNSNAPLLAALVQAAGGEPRLLGTAKDMAEELEAKLNDALQMAADDAGKRRQLLLIAGGVSVGRFDLVEAALAKFDASFRFTGVSMTPGKPLVFGQVPIAGRAPLIFFGLPGNPVSAAVTFRVFVEPFLRTLGGEAGYGTESRSAFLTDGWVGKKGLTKFLPAVCNAKPADDLLPRVHLLRWHGSGDLASYARSNCLVVIPEDVEALMADEPVQILMRR